MMNETHGDTVTYRNDVRCEEYREVHTAYRRVQGGMEERRPPP